MYYNGRKIKSAMTQAIDKLRVPRNTELAIQSSIVAYLRRMKILVFSVPNGSHFENQVTRALMSLAGLTPGVSDLIIVIKGAVVFVEVKTAAKTSTQSDDQIKFQEQVEDLGFTYQVWRSLDDAIYFRNNLDLFLNNKFMEKEF